MACHFNIRRIAMNIAIYINNKNMLQTHKALFKNSSFLIPLPVIDNLPPKLHDL